MPTETNLYIAQAAKLQDIQALATGYHLADDEFEPLGRAKAKLSRDGIRRLVTGKKGKLVLVSAITPTPAGEGKTTTTIGLAQGLCKIGHTAIPCVREPSLGPIFGNKGGACGGGYSQVLPMEDINLFFTGDFPAVSSAHNLLAAAIDAHLHHGNRCRLDARRITWPRTIDMNDRALREIVIGLGGSTNGYSREDGFVVCAASEIMAILCMTTGMEDLKARLAQIVVGQDDQAAPVRAGALGVVGAMAALLREAIRPNLVQTLEGGLAFVHGGPFANIAHGCSSVLATQCSLGLAEFTVTEAGFASDLGAEKFMNLVVPQIGKAPEAVVLVATVRALRHHGGGELGPGLRNLEQHASHLKKYGAPVVVAINRFEDDEEHDHRVIHEACRAMDVGCASANPWGGGGEGCRQLAKVVNRVANQPSTFEPLYRPTDSIARKLHLIASEVYGAIGIRLLDGARRRLVWAEKHGMGHLSPCVAKTQYSFADDAAKGHTPTDFEVTIRELRPLAGAGYITALAGEIMLMPGLGKEPAAFGIDVIDDQIIGLV